MGYINPLLELPAARELLELSPGERSRLEKVMRALRHQANEQAELYWSRRKGLTAAYWRAVSTYARHTAHALAKGRRHAA